MEDKLEEVLTKLKKSNFRSKFHLKESDILYIEKKGKNTILNHAYDFIQKRLAPQKIENDGKQTPMRGHPVFIAQHATATCCRECLWKWHHIDKNRELTKEEQEYIVSLIMKWIQREIEKDA